MSVWDKGRREVEKQRGLHLSHPGADVIAKVRRGTPGDGGI